MSNANFDMSVSDRFTGSVFPSFSHHAYIIHCTQKEKKYLANTQGHAKVLQVSADFISLIS